MINSKKLNSISLRTDRFVRFAYREKLDLVYRVQKEIIKIFNFQDINPGVIRTRDPDSSSVYATPWKQCYHDTDLLEIATVVNDMVAQIEAESGYKQVSMMTSTFKKEVLFQAPTLSDVVVGYAGFVTDSSSSECSKPDRPCVWLNIMINFIWQLLSSTTESIFV